ncbi:MAG: DUF6132 family protein [Syntrophothermus sp.]
MSSCNTQRPRNLKDFLRSSYFLKPFAVILTGAVAGFLYYYFIGCSSGSCAITSSPYMSTLAGGFLGFFAMNSPCSKC